MENNTEKNASDKDNLYTIIFFIILIIGTIYFSFNEKTYHVTVVDKGTSSWIIKKPLIICRDDKGNELEFENTNQWLRLKFNSSQLQREMQIGKTYVITTVGAKTPLDIYFENIIEIELSDDK